jgi:hypothetical protein
MFEILSQVDVLLQLPEASPELPLSAVTLALPLSVAQKQVGAFQKAQGVKGIPDEGGEHR